MSHTDGKVVLQLMFHEGPFLGVEEDRFQDPHRDRASPNRLHPGRLHVCHDCPVRLRCEKNDIAGDVSLTPSYGGGLHTDGGDGYAPADGGYIP
jgi:hypothetical protein